MVISGLGEAAGGDIEFAKLEEDPSYTCSKIHAYPLKIRNHVAIVYNEKLTVCGGEVKKGEVSKICYQLNAETNDWIQIPSMNHPRKYFTATVTEKGL